MSTPWPERVAIVVHPKRPIAEPLATLEGWAKERGLDVVQIPTIGPGHREVAPKSNPAPGDLIVALGGDGTVLSALRAAAPVNAPVFGAACGSLGVLTAVMADDFGTALERFAAGDWTPRRLPALAIQPADSAAQWAINDFVAVRRGAGQLVANVSVDDELYVRLAGDGLIVATPLGSSAYSMAAGGPIVTGETPAFVFTPVAMHGGNAPPLVVSATSSLRVELHPGYAGFDIEIDGHNEPATDLDYTLTLREDRVTLVGFGETSLGLAELRERGLVSDSARVLARDARLVTDRQLPNG
jgi:NAD+ kinase